MSLLGWIGFAGYCIATRPITAGVFMAGAWWVS